MSRRNYFIPLLLSLTRIAATVDPNAYRPVAYRVGTQSPASPSSFEEIRPGLKFCINASSPVLTLDYGAEVAGFPFVNIEAISGNNVQIELKYSEPYEGLSLPYGDGPFLFVVGLMNSFRTETFNITGPGRIESFFIQGGQRWQSIRLLTESAIVISDVGFRPSVAIEPPENLIGAFSSSDDILQPLWNLGARAVQASCVESHSQPSTWEITDEGVLVRGQFPAYSAKGLGWGNYTLSFSTKIVRGGTGWRVAAGANNGYGPYFVLTTSGPHLANANTTVLPFNTLTVGFGHSIVNQTILSSAARRHFPVPFEVLPDEWYSITTSISAAGYNISIDGTHVAFVDSSSYDQWNDASWGSNSTTDGTWGFGPFVDQAAHYTDVQVTSDAGETLYANDLKDSHVLAEYRVAPNRHKVCLDGAKRDRLIWIGDFVHTARILAASTGGYDFIRSMIEYTFEWQLTDGPGANLVPMQEAMGDGWEFRHVYFPSQYGIHDYELFFLLVVGDYYALTDDLALMEKHWDGLKRLVNGLVERFLDGTSGLLADPNDLGLWFTAPQQGQNATAPTALFVIALQEVVPIAKALDDVNTVKYLTTLAQNMTDAINTRLWSDNLRTYVFALASQTDFSILSAAFPIRAGIANTTQATLAIQSLSELFLNIGYKDSTFVGSSSPQTHVQLSPNVQGFLLESLFLAHTKHNVPASVVVPVLDTLLHVYWPHMVNQDKYYTGTSWEYVFADGSPGIGIFTSLCHPWGGAPTYVLTNYVLGIRREMDEKTGVYVWVVDPVWEVVEGLGLKWAKGRMPLPGGGYLEAEWSILEGGRRCEAKVNRPGDGIPRVVGKGSCRLRSSEL